MIDSLGKFSRVKTDMLLAEHGFQEGASTQQFIKAANAITPDSEKALLKHLGTAGHLDNLMRQTKEARALKAVHAAKLEATLTKLGNEKTGAQLLDELSQIGYAETSTTHPLQIATAREEHLSTAFVKRVDKVLSLNETKLTAHDFFKTKAHNAEKQLGRIARRFENLPSQNLDKLTALDEVRLKIPYTKNAALGWAETNATLKQIVFNTQGQVMEHDLTSFASWMGADNDRNDILKATDILETARHKQQAAFQLQARALGKTANGSYDDAFKMQIFDLRKRLLNTAYTLDAKMEIPKGDYAKFGTFDSAEAYIKALRDMRNTPQFAKHRHALEKLISLGEGAGFHLVEGEARQNAKTLEDVMSLVYQKEGMVMPSPKKITTKSDLALFDNLAENFDRFKKTNLDELAFDMLGEKRGGEARKLVDCLKNYKIVRDLHGDKALSRLVIAEARSPADVTAMQILCENLGLTTQDRNGLKIIPLVESSEDKKFMRAFLDKVISPNALSGSGGRAARAFLKGLEIMQAASDTLRVNGQIYGLRAINAFANYINRVFDRRWLYWGLGSDGQRTLGDLPHRMIEYLFSGVKKFRQTVQGSEVQLVNRTAALANMHSLATLSTHIENALGPDLSELYKLHDAPVQAWSKAARNLHVKMVTGGAANVDVVLNELTPTRFVGAFNTGSRAGKGLFGKAYKLLTDFAPVTYMKSRAISLAFGGKASGLNATTIGMGHSLDRLVKKDPEFIAKLHEAYKAVPGFRLTVDSTTRVVSYGNHGPVRSFFETTLKRVPAVSSWFNYHEKDSALLRDYLPKIVNGATSTVAFEELPVVGRALGNPFWAKVAQTLVSKNTAQVLAKGVETELNATATGKAFKLMRLAGTTLTRITSRFA